MCLAIPAKIIKIEDGVGTLDVDGVERQASLTLLEDAAVGDFVILHAGFAIHKLPEDEALQSLKILKEMASLADQETSS